ncbi:MAG: type II secretion system protein [Vulcanimicrobiota bacterium]
MTKRSGVTLIEVLVSAGILALVMTAVISFYVEAVAVSAKRDENSARLRRFHLGLEKMDQVLREARIVDVRFRSILFLKLSDGSELAGFPLYDPAPGQLASTEKGVILIQDGKETVFLPTQPGEHVIFDWLQENPPNESKEAALTISLYHTGFDKRSDLFFHRSVNVQLY